MQQPKGPHFILHHHELFLSAGLTVRVTPCGGHSRELCRKRPNRSGCRLGVWTRVDRRNHDRVHMSAT